VVRLLADVRLVELEEGVRGGVGDVAVATHSRVLRKELNCQGGGGAGVQSIAKGVFARR